MGNDRVFITSMKVQVSSGVQLSLFPDTDSENEFVAETTITSKLSAKYQVSLTSSNHYSQNRLSHSMILFTLQYTSQSHSEN